MRGFDFGALDAVEVLSFDADEFYRLLASWRVDVANIVEMSIAGLHRIGPDRFDQRRLVTLALFDDLPVRHFGYAVGLPVDCPA